MRRSTTIGSVASSGRRTRCCLAKRRWLRRSNTRRLCLKLARPLSRLRSPTIRPTIIKRIKMTRAPLDLNWCERLPFQNNRFYRNSTRDKKFNTKITSSLAKINRITNLDIQIISNSAKISSFKEDMATETSIWKLTSCWTRILLQRCRQMTSGRHHRFCLEYFKLRNVLLNLRKHRGVAATLDTRDSSHLRGLPNTFRVMA